MLPGNSRKERRLASWRRGKAGAPHSPVRHSGFGPRRGVLVRLESKPEHGTRVACVSSRRPGQRARPTLQSRTPVSQPGQGPKRGGVGREGPPQRVGKARGRGAGGGDWAALQPDPSSARASLPSRAVCIIYSPTPHRDLPPVTQTHCCSEPARVGDQRGAGGGPGAALLVPRSVGVTFCTGHGQELTRENRVSSSGDGQDSLTLLGPTGSCVPDRRPFPRGLGGRSPPLRFLGVSLAVGVHVCFSESEL